MRYWKTSICLTFLVMNAAWGQEATRTAEPRFGSRYRSGRALAMGDAFIAQSDDGASALMYNPAALGKLRRLELELTNVQIEANSDFLEKVGFKSVTFPSLASYAPTLAGRSWWAPGAGGSFFPNVSYRGIGAGMFMQSRLWAQNKGGTIRYRSIYQVVPTAGVALRLASGVIRLGYSVQWVNKSVADEDIGWSVTQGWGYRARAGHAISHTAAFSLNIPRTYLPSINIVGRNIGGAKYIAGGLVAMLAKDSQGAPETEAPQYDVGLGFSPRLNGNLTSRLNIDYHDMTGASGVFIPVKVSVGAELGIKETIFLRAGYGNGYPSAGLGVQGNNGTVSISWWSEELSTDLWSQRDNRFMFHYQFKIFAPKEKAETKDEVVNKRKPLKDHY